MARAEAEGREYLGVRAEEAKRAGSLATVGWFGRRRAQREHDTVRDRTQDLGGRLSTEWGTVPCDVGDLDARAACVAAQWAENEPEVVEADDAVAEARQARTGSQQRHRPDRLLLLARLHGPENVRRDPDRFERANPRREAARWRTTAEEARNLVAELRGLPPDQAVYFREVRRAAAETREAALRERQRQLPDDPPP